MFLIKNSDLNFQLKETPFSLDISIKKRFVNHWNQSSQSNQNQNVVYPGSPQNETIFHPSAPHHNFQRNQTQDSSNLLETSDLLKQIDSLKANYEEAVNDNEETHKNLLELDQKHKKLSKVNKELQKKHEKICSEMKILRNEKEIILRESNNLSVALKSNKKDSETNLKRFRV